MHELRAKSQLAFSTGSLSISVTQEVFTYPLTREQLMEELSHFVEYWCGQGVRTCSVLFGFAWGNDYYSDDVWREEVLPLRELEAKVNEVESSGIGSLGFDDLFIKIDSLEFHFCNDSDIHIAFGERRPAVEHFHLRWTELGYNPRERHKREPYDQGKSERDA